MDLNVEDIRHDGVDSMPAETRNLIIQNNHDLLLKHPNFMYERLCTRAANVRAFIVGVAMYSIVRVKGMSGLRTMGIFSGAGRVFSVDELEFCIAQKYGGEAAQ